MKQFLQAIALSARSGGALIALSRLIKEGQGAVKFSLNGRSKLLILIDADQGELARIAGIETLIHSGIIDLSQPASKQSPPLNGSPATVPPAMTPPTSLPSPSNEASAKTLDSVPPRPSKGDKVLGRVAQGVALLQTLRGARA